MPLVKAGDRQIFFAHVPKTGGSSVEDYLVRRFGPLSLIDRNKRRGIRGTGLIVPVTHLAATDLVELMPHDLHASFAVVRHPMERLKSEYRYQTGVSRASRLSFSTWLRVVLAACRRDARIYENHIRPQTDLVPEDATVFRLEDGFGPMIAWLDEVTGTTAPDIVMDHLLKRRHAPITLTCEDHALVEAAYFADYARFGYDKADLGDQPRDRRAGLRNAAGAVLGRLLVMKQHRAWLR